MSGRERESLLDLFRLDVESQVQSMVAALSALKRHKPAAEPLESCVCAAGSLNDAAHMVGLTPASTLAAALEECFIGARRGRIALPARSIDLLLGGADLLLRIARTPAADLEQWSGSRSGEVDAQLESLARLRDGREWTDIAPRAAAGPATASEAPTVAQSAGIDGGSLLDQFRAEANRQAQALDDGLHALQRDGGEREAMESCRHAAHALIGASRTIGLGAGLIVAHALEAAFVAARQEKKLLRPEAIELFRRGVELFGRIARTPEGELALWAGEKRGEVKAFLGELDQLRQAGGATAAAPIETAGAAATPPQSAAESVALDSSDGDALLEMFISETLNLAQVLTTGMRALEREPDWPEQLESCMRAAHSLKGAARIVGLTLGVTLARAMEESFIAAQRGRIRLSRGALALLQRAIDLFVLMARATPADFGQWGSDRRPEVEGLLIELKRVREGIDDEPALAPAPAAPAAEPLAARPLPVLGLGTADRVVLLDLFQDEAEHLSQTLTAGLLALVSNPGAAEALADCLTAANSFKDAARTIGLSIAVNLARALEECFAAAQQGHLQLRQEVIDLLLRGADLLAFIGRTPQAAFGAWGHHKLAEIDLLLADLKRMHEGGRQDAVDVRESRFERTFMGAGRRLT